MVSNKGEDLLALLQAGNGMVRNGTERQKSRHRRVGACKWWEREAMGDSFAYGRADVIKG